MVNLSTPDAGEGPARHAVMRRVSGAAAVAEDALLRDRAPADDAEPEVPAPSVVNVKVLWALVVCLSCLAF